MNLDEVLSTQFRKIEDILKKHQVYLVGGYLRNYFLKNELSYDKDLVCLDNSKILALEIAKKLDGTFIELDKENQIYRVVLKDKKNFFDISLALENDILKDAKRRDFTINSIFYDLNKKEIFDPLDGIGDIKKRIIKTYDLNNLKDDPLRFLRLYRFISLTGFEADRELSEFCRNNFELVFNCAKERINYEIIQMFEGSYISQTLLKMYDDGTLEKLFPFVKEIKRVPSNSHHHLDLVHHSIETVRNIRINKPVLKIAAFYHDIGKPSTWTIEPKGRHRFIGHDIKGAQIVKSELEKLKFSNKQISYIQKMIKYHIYPATLIHANDTKKDNNNKAFARFIRKLGSDTPDVIELSRADRLSARGSAVSEQMVQEALNHLDNLLNYYNEVKNMAQNPKSLLDGNEIMQILNIKPSKLLGEIIEKLIEAQLSNSVKTKEEAIEFVKNIGI